MKTRKLKRIVRQFSFDGKTAIIVRGDPPMRMIEQLVKLPLPALKGTPIIVLPEGVGLESADEERMRRAGWVRG